MNQKKNSTPLYVKILLLVCFILTEFLLLRFEILEGALLLSFIIVVPMLVNLVEHRYGLISSVVINTLFILIVLSKDEMLKNFIWAYSRRQLTPIEQTQLMFYPFIYMIAQMVALFISLLSIRKKRN